ncbi:MAG: hypothetical protein K0R87_2029, partial [Pseudonocardia sp.]|nr:hypothetical protein [Pseudonocardia sp.]
MSLDRKAIVVDISSAVTYPTRTASGVPAESDDAVKRAAYSSDGGISVITSTSTPLGSATMKWRWPNASLVPQRELGLQSLANDEPLPLGVGVVDLEVQQQAADRCAVRRGQRGVLVVEHGELVGRIAGTTQPHVPVR